MSIRKFFFLSLAFGVLAVGLDVVAMSLHRRGDHAITAFLLSSVHEVGVAKRLEGQGYLNLATLIGIVGIAFVVAGLVCVVISARKREPAWRTLNFALLLLCVVLQFYLVLQFALT